MADPAYVAAAVGVAVAITVALRVVPFAVRNAMGDSRLLADLGHRMPLGAMAILAVYCLSSIDVGAPGHGVDRLLGVAATVGMHAWRRNAVLSILAGTAVCLVLANTMLAR